MLLVCLIFIPFLGGIICWQFEHFGIKISKFIAFITMLITVFICLFLFLVKKNSVKLLLNFSKFYIIYFSNWIPYFGINIYFGLDDLSLIMITLTSILGFFSVFCSWSEIRKYQGFFYFNLLWIIGSMFGIFLSVDMFLFFFFWEMILLPIYFLITIWGHKNSENKNNVFILNKFFVYSQISGLILLISILSLVVIHHGNTGIWTFNYNDLLFTIISNNKLKYFLMICFFLAFAIKIPVIPLHGWLPDTHSQAPTAGSVDLAGILLKTAAYGLLRFSLPFFPEASQKFAPIAMSLGIIGIFYGSFLAYSQHDIKRLIAYTSISHMGFILMAIYSGNKLAYQGAILSMFAHGLSSSGMFIICGQLYERLYTRDIRLMGGLWKNINFLPACFFVFAVSMFGMPGTINFIGEIIILLGTFITHPIFAIISTLSIFFSFIYSLNLMQQVYYGQNEYIDELLELTFREKIILILLLILILTLGFFPEIIIKHSFFAAEWLENWINKYKNI